MSKTSRIHTRTYRGHWVRVELRDGRRFTAQFVERDGGKRIHFKGVRPLRRGEISRFICFGSFSPNSDFSKANPWDTIKREEV